MVPETHHWDSIASIVEQLGALPSDDHNRALLLRASRLPYYALFAVRAMGMRRDPAYLEPLRERLMVDLPGLGPDQREMVRIAAVQALAAQLSQDAARCLLEGWTADAGKVLRKRV